MKNEFTLAFNEIMSERSLSREVVLEAIEQALVNAYKRDAQITTKQAIEAHIDNEGKTYIFVEKEVVEDVIGEQTEVALADALERHPEAELGEMVMMPVTNTSSNFGRIAAQTAKQVILQRIREAEREALYDEFIEREGDLITGKIQSISNKFITLSLGRTEGIMPRQHQIPNEHYRQHEPIRTYVVEVNKGSRGPQIVVSRAHKDMLRRLLEYEVPEIYNGQVEIRNIAREAGYRSKVAVEAIQEGIDPVGACVGMRGMRIQNIIKELNNEKIDVIEWDPEPRRFIAKALSPARVTGVFLHEDLDHPRTATVIVPDDQLSLAIGKEGQNARLAAKLTNWRIDIKSLSETAFENFDLMQAENIGNYQGKYADLYAEAERILEKKSNNRPIMPEEFTTLTRFVETSESIKHQLEQAEVDERRQKLETVRDLVPERAFEMPIEVLELADDINNALRSIANVGELMVRVLSDEENLEAMLLANKAKDDAMEAIRYALDDLVIPELDKPVEPEVVEAEPATIEVEQSVEQSEAVVEEVAAVAEAEIVDELDAVGSEEAEDDSEELEDEIELDIDDELTPEMWPEEEFEEPRTRRKSVTKAKRTETPDEVDEWVDPEELTEQKSKKKSKRKRVQLVYDEEIGEVVAKRRRKGSRRRSTDEIDDLDLDIDLEF